MGSMGTSSPRYVRGWGCRGSCKKRVKILDVISERSGEIFRMVCELLLSSVWLLFVVFWVETISVWLFLCLFYQDRAFYHWGDGVIADDPGQMLYMLSRSDRSIHTQT